MPTFYNNQSEFGRRTWTWWWKKGLGVTFDWNFKGPNRWVSVELGALGRGVQVAVEHEPEETVRFSYTLHLDR